jgi:catechol 2,3-dioxygenase-like lactoylglutathione lyase family enzyme
MHALRIIANLRVTDVDAAKSFYTDYLGLTLILASGSERGWLGTVQDPWWCESAYLTGK